MVTAALILARGFMMLRARFGRDHVGDLVHQFCVPAGGEADRLWKDSRRAGSSAAVRSFVPIAVPRDAETVDGWRRVHHLRNFFFQRHARDEIGDAGFDRETRILVCGLGLAEDLAQRRKGAKENAKNDAWSPAGFD